MQFENTITIHCSVREVFDYLSRFENIPQWNYAIELTTKTSPGAVGVGSTYTQVRHALKRSEEEFEIVEFVPNSDITIDGTIGPFTGRVSYRLRAVDETTTRLTNSADMHATGMVAFVAPLLKSNSKRAVAKNLAVLKQIIERQN